MLCRRLVHTLEAFIPPLQVMQAETFHTNGLKFALILNPKDGDFKHPTVQFDAWFQNEKLLENKDSWIPAFLYSKRNAHEILSKIDEYTLGNAMIIFRTCMDMDDESAWSIISNESVGYVVNSFGSTISRRLRSRLKETGKQIIRLDMIFGLYSRFGNTTGAFASLLTGMGLALLFITCQRTWASAIYPFLVANDLHIAAGNFFAACSAPFEPWIVWRVNPHKFPINSYEINFIIMILCLFAYVAGSLLTFKEKFNLDRMLHRGIYNTDGENKNQFKWSIRTVFKKLIGITPDYTLGDKIITWSVFFYSFFYKFIGCFLLVVIWNAFSPWPVKWWGTYFYVVYLVVPFIAAFFTTFWFLWGGVKDMFQMFRDLRERMNIDHLDNGQVEGNVSLSDAAVFAEKERREKAGK